MNSIENIAPKGQLKRVVIVGAGFAGLKLARKLPQNQFQVVLIDKNNYHQFQPLFYQVATAGLEPSSISFPLRKALHKRKNIHIRTAQAQNIDVANHQLLTDIGSVNYDYLVLALGADTNYFNMVNIAQNAIPMKSVTEALYLRNTILQNFEDALNTTDPNELAALMNIIVVGGGPTGVELAGAIAEMKKHVLPKDYPELDFTRMHIYLVESSDKVLGVMSSQAAYKAHQYLTKLGVEVLTNVAVKDYDGHCASLANGQEIYARTLLWAAGIKANSILGLPNTVYGRGGRLITDAFNAVQGYPDIFALGDMALTPDDKYPNGHPQVAPVAIQQADNLAKNLVRMQKQQNLLPFKYVNQGSLATIGRNLAVADLPSFKLRGFLAWILWLFVHLMSIVGVKNRLFIFINWAWSYFTYDQSLRLLIKPYTKQKMNQNQSQ
ncbi:MAG: NAD(P)/FAD-dependent oxidoreductase [Sphingobacteriales bacterium]|jgi:NADH dehydrogenase|nr:NAD(P)/FAD-dependent oxidoreductase [Sphingobacteriales bacterium]MBP9141823.1 NAD(P)/FAD-dependent oxidoreductase [Chitinophagales bacterium]MDA0198883.1 NAD(P)/FAD-dependent oxidoreductase [Bacteroidota bacterium]MBK6889785.1 NAD(P)/FAD-dependent oxidoreductase [Sphingobacteriales bacterium]MBK7527700.1 NAD(P)/FAD-dependent oxidoreductase [Sphingobacteriales bacterium]